MEAPSSAPVDPTTGPLAEALTFYRVDEHRDYRFGYVEVRRYRWGGTLHHELVNDTDAILLNMPLPPRSPGIRVTQHRSAFDLAQLGRVLVLMPGSRFLLTAPEGGLRALHCAIDRTWFVEVLGERLAWQEGTAMELMGSVSSVPLLLNRIWHELRDEQFASDIAIEAYATTLCVELARRLRSGDPRLPDMHKGGLAPWRLNAIEARVNGPGAAPHLQELARLCGMTERQLGRAFKAETGQTLGRYVAAATADRARHLLVASRKPVAEIARELGFSSGASFATAFKRVTGLLPSEVRKRAEDRIPVDH